MNKAWAVVGAGPAGIAAVGQLMDSGIAADDILWVDPAFRVGDFGTKWQHVSSNTRVARFYEYFNAIKAFEYDRAPAFDLDDYDKDGHCALGVAAQPIQWISDRLAEQVLTVQDSIVSLHPKQGGWVLQGEQAEYEGKQVILAMGAEPQILPFSGPHLIDIQTALTPTALQAECQANDTIAVFGSSHSAIMIVRDCLAYGVKKVINFYLEPIKYALPMDGWILFDTAGLKGQTAKWAKTEMPLIEASRLTRLGVNPRKHCSPLTRVYQDGTSSWFLRHAPNPCSVALKQYLIIPTAVSSRQVYLVWGLLFHRHKSIQWVP